MTSTQNMESNPILGDISHAIGCWFGVTPEIKSEVIVRESKDKGKVTKTHHYITIFENQRKVSAYIGLVPFLDGDVISLSPVITRRESSPIVGAYRFLCEVGVQHGLARGIPIVFKGFSAACLKDGSINGCAINFDRSGFISINDNVTYTDAKDKTRKMYLNDYPVEHLKMLCSIHAVAKPPSQIAYGVKQQLSKPQKVKSQEQSNARDIRMIIPGFKAQRVYVPGSAYTDKASQIRGKRLTTHQTKFTVSELNTFVSNVHNNAWYNKTEGEETPTVTMISPDDIGRYKIHVSRDLVTIFIDLNNVADVVASFASMDKPLRDLYTNEINTDVDVVPDFTGILYDAFQQDGVTKLHFSEAVESAEQNIKGIKNSPSNVANAFLCEGNRTIERCEGAFAGEVCQMQDFVGKSEDEVQATRTTPQPVPRTPKAMRNQPEMKDILTDEE